MIGSTTARGLRGAIAVALVAAAIGAADPWERLVGGWRVAAVGLGLDAPFARIEVRTSGRGAIIAASGDRGALGEARLSWSGDDAQGEFVNGDDRITLRLRPTADGRLSALVRRRDRRQPDEVPEQVRQLVLEPEDRRVALPAPTAPEPARPGEDLLEGDRAGLFVVGIDGRALRSVAPPVEFRRASQPCWSPDGRRIAFAAFDATGRDPLIRVVAAAGGTTTAVAAGISPSWSRDGSRLAYVASGKPEFARDWSDPGRNEERIEALSLSGPDAGSVEVLARGFLPRWAPDDDRLVFVASVGRNWDVYLRTADGQGLIRLTDDPSQDTEPSWAADGRSVVFLSNRGNRWDLYRVAADGRGTPERITNGRRREDRATLSPDGTLAAFADRPGRPDGRILLLDLAAGTVRPLLDPPRGDSDPAFSPDGRSIAFISRRPGPLPPPAGGREEDSPQRPQRSRRRKEREY